MPLDPSAQKAFFQIAFGKAQGYICIAYRDVQTNKFDERFYEWPAQLDKIITDIQTHELTNHVYFCPQLFETRRIKKDNVKCCPSAWADLDTCTPDKLQVEPTVTIESSPGRFQAVWCFEEPLDPVSAEDISRRIAYYHAAHGADRSGWDLTQLLRVPGTYNFKYSPSIGDAPPVQIRKLSRNKYTTKDFLVYPAVKGTKELTLPIPEEVLKEAPEDIIQRFRRKINPYVFGLFGDEPVEDWSKALWKLLMYCFEAGMDRDEVYAVALPAKCNKYARDNKPPEYLWRDVCRAYLKHKENTESVVNTFDLDSLLSDQEMRDVSSRSTFVERYIDWATGLGDAAPQYHQAGAFIILSSLLAGNVKLPTSFGTILPNLWFMILADTTLTRKTTAMDIAMDLVGEIDEDILLATDGSIEGLLTALSLRAGKSSVFLRDEFSGLLEMMTKRDYYAGMGELLTKMYDGKNQKRVLRKETLTVEKPILIVFAGGIKARIQSLLTFDDVSSGFIPRFLFVTAESDVKKVQALGPPSAKDILARERVLDDMRSLAGHYKVEQTLIMQATGMRIPKPRVFDAKLTPDAWARFNKLESDLLKAGTSVERPELMTPLYSRLGISALKASVLIAASRQREEEVIVEEADIVHALKYAEGWRQYANEVVNGIGKNAAERALDRILVAVVKSPGISRSKLMQYYHLTAREADAVFSTLEQRGMITRRMNGRTQVFYPEVEATR